MARFWRCKLQAIPADESTETMRVNGK